MPDDPPKPPRVLLCSPEHYGVQYVINPWMTGHIGQARARVANRSWEALKRLLESLTEVEVVAGQPGLPDMCFVANAGFVLGDTFVPANFRVPQRQGEVAGFTAWFEKRGFRIAPLPPDQPFEGEGDVLPQHGSDYLWAGYGVRTSLEAHRSLQEKLDIQVVSLRLIDERFYHLDTCLFPLPGGRVVYYPEAFDTASLGRIHERIPRQQRYEVSDVDALGFACNALRIGRQLVTHQASAAFRQRMQSWGFTLHTTDVGEFLLAGGAVKCLALLIDQDVMAREATPPSPIRTTRMRLAGHLLDSGALNLALNKITDQGGSFQIEQLHAAERHDEPSHAAIRMTAPDNKQLDQIVSELLPLGAEPVDPPIDATLDSVTQAGVAPEAFHCTTIYPTEVRIQGRWHLAGNQRMDAVLVTRGDGVTCELIRNLKPGDRVVCGNDGVRIQLPAPNTQNSDTFGFMQAGVSSERRVEQQIEHLAWEMQRLRACGGRIVLVAGPVVIHAGGGPHLAKLIDRGYVQTLLTGNALPVHDIESSFFGTSLGVDLARGHGVLGGHQHHLRAINRIRHAGSIRGAVEQGVLTSGVMHACVIHNIPYVLAGSIRDDGPLPETLMDLREAQAAYAKHVRSADMILMLASTLHAIGAGNMTPSGVRLICVDISPAVMTKLADRGSLESTGIVTDVGLFLNLLTQRLEAKDRA